MLSYAQFPFLQYEKGEIVAGLERIPQLTDLYFALNLQLNWSVGEGFPKTGKS